MSSDYTGLALVISAFLTPVSVMFGIWVNNRSVKRVDAKVDTVDTKVDTVHAIATLVDLAVNGKEPGETTLSEDMTQAKDDITTIKDKQELDAPSDSSSGLVVTKTNGNASIRLQLALVQTTLEKLLAKTA